MNVPTPKRRWIFDLTRVSIDGHIVNDQVGVDTVGWIKFIIEKFDSQVGTGCVVVGIERKRLEFGRGGSCSNFHTVGKQSELLSSFIAAK